MKNILVPCDFSKASEQALRFAIEIAALSRGEVTVLHVISLTPNYIEALEKKVVRSGFNVYSC